MNETFRKRQFSFLLKLGLFTFLVGGVHFYLFNSLFAGTLIFFGLWQIYAFHFVTVLLIYSVINYKYSHGKTAIFNYFMVATLLKMALALVFLLPLILSDLPNKLPDAINFFIPYFLFLAFEVYGVVFLLNKPE